MAQAAVAGFSPLRPWLDLRSVSVGLLMDRVALGQVLPLDRVALGQVLPLDRVALGTGTSHG